MLPNDKRYRIMTSGKIADQSNIIILVEESWSYAGGSKQ